ncbi:MAG: hypothetical protein AAGH40_06420 [Verrucomicrobiota bacterium]
MELLSQIYFWALFLVGVGISLWGFKRKRSKGYLLIAVFFLSPLFGALYREISYQLHKEEIKIMNKERNLHMEQMIAEGHTPFVEQNVRLLLFESILVLGLFLTIRNPDSKSADCGNG